MDHALRHLAIHFVRNHALITTPVTHVFQTPYADGVDSWINVLKEIFERLLAYYVKQGIFTKAIKEDVPIISLMQFI